MMWRIGDGSNQQASAMKAIDRVMRAYSSTRALSEGQAEIARRELSHFIDELLLKPSPHQVDNEGDILKSD